MDLTERLRNAGSHRVTAAAGARIRCMRSPPPGGCWKWWHRFRGPAADAHGERISHDSIGAGRRRSRRWQAPGALPLTLLGTVPAGRSGVEAAKAGRTISVVLPALNEEV